MVENTDQFNETDMHLLGPNWTHYKCNKCGEGTHTLKKPTDDRIIEEEIALETIEINEDEIIDVGGEAANIDSMIEQAKELVKTIKLMKEFIETATDIPEKQEFEEAQAKWNETIEKIKENLPTAELNDKETQLSELLERIGEQINEKDWKRDPIQKTKKRVEKNGAIIVRAMRTDRKIIPELFVKNHPLITNELVNEGKVTIPLKYAEEKLSKTAVNAVCSIKETKTYEMRINPRAEGAVVNGR